MVKREKKVRFKEREKAGKKERRGRREEETSSGFVVDADKNCRGNGEFALKIDIQKAFDSIS